MSNTPTTPVMFDDGSSGMFTNEQLPNALQNGGKIGQRVRFDDGSDALIPLDQVHDAIKDGGTLAGIDPGPPQTRMTPGPETPPGGLWGVYRAARGLVGSVPGIYHAFADAPRNQEEQNVQDNPTPDPFMPKSPLLGRFGLAYKRLVEDPSTQARQQAQEMEDLADQKYGKQAPGVPASIAKPGTPAASIARTMFGPSGQPFTPMSQTLSQPGNAHELALRESAGALRMGSLIPFVGPLAAHLSITAQGDPTSNSADQQNPYGTEGDPTGALAEGLGYALAPAAQERVMGEIGEALPTREDIATGLRTSGAKNISRALGAGTLANKQISEQIAPEIAQRGITAWTRRGLQRQAEAQTEQLGQDIDQYYQNLPEGTTVPTKPILDHFDQTKQNFMGSNGEILDQNAIDRIDALKQVVQQFGQNVPVDDIVKLRRLWDEQVSQATKGNYSQTLAEASDLAAKREGATAIRQQLAQQFPDLNAINQEFSFWANVRRVIGATNLRKAAQGPALGETLWTGMGLMKGGPKMALAMRALDKVFTSTKWATTAGKWKFQIADMLADGDVEGAANLATQQTGVAAPKGPAPYPAWTATGQGTLPFGQEPPAAGGGGEPPEEPPAGGGGAPQQPVAPPFAGAGQRRQDVPSPGVPYAIPGAEVGEVPSRNRPIYPDFARPPETQPAQPAPLTATPERLAQQKAAVDQAAELAQNGEVNKEAYTPLEEQSYLPELEREDLRGGKQTNEIYKDANGNYTPERQALHERIIQKILGSGPGAEGQPRVIYLGGGAASGKTEAVLKSLREQYPDAVIIDPDEIKQQLPEWNTLKQSDPLRGAFRLHEESSDIGNEAIARAAETRRNIIVDKVNGNGPKVIKEMENFRNRGYQVDARYADRDVAGALQSMVSRFRSKGRWVPPYILDANHAEAARAFHQVAPTADYSSLHMARGGPHQLVYENGKVYNNELYNEHLKKGGYDSDDGLRLRSQPENAGPNGQGLRGVRSEESQSPSSAGGAQGAGGIEGEAGGPEQTPEEVAPPQGRNAPLIQGERIAGQDGASAQLFTAGGKQYPVRYRVVDLGDLKTSHNAETFAKNPEYPEGIQERAYHSSKEAQNRVINQSQNFEPSFLLNNTPTAVDGPPIITPDGTVIGGNSRAMTLNRLAGRGAYDAFKQPLLDQAQQFGIDPEQVRDMRTPVLVREINPGGTVDDMRRVASDLNKPFTGEMSTSERAVSAGKSIRPESLQQIANMQNELGEGTSLRELMQKRPQQMLDILQRDGLITDRERPSMVDTERGELNEDGKNFVEKALIGSVVDDPDLMDRAPRSILNKLGGSLPDIAGLSARGDEYNITPLVREALREHVKAAQQRGPFEDYVAQGKMFGGMSAPVEAIARALNGPVKNVRKAFTSFAQDARADVAGQNLMPGMTFEKPSAAGAFNHAFGTELTDPELRSALSAALAAEKTPAAGAASAEIRPNQRPNVE